jgi:hypothetical protein
MSDRSELAHVEQEKKDQALISSIFVISVSLILVTLSLVLLKYLEGQGWRMIWLLPWGWFAWRIIVTMVEGTGMFTPFHRWEQSILWRQAQLESEVRSEKDGNDYVTIVRA